MRLAERFSSFHSNPSQPSRSHGKLFFCVSAQDVQSSCMAIINQQRYRCMPERSIFRIDVAENLLAAPVFILNCFYLFCHIYPTWFLIANLFFVLPQNRSCVSCIQVEEICRRMLEAKKGLLSAPIRACRIC